MFPCLSKKKSLFRRRSCIVNQRVFFAPLLVFIVISAHAQSSLCTYGDDFYEATLHKSTLETLAAPALTGAFSNYVTQPAGFGSGGEGLGYHYGVSLADNVQGKFVRKFIFAAASRSHDKYSPLGSAAPFKTRIKNVVLHSLLSVPRGSSRLNWSALPASLASAALSNAYQPDQQRTVAATFQRFGTNSAGYLFGDLVAELTFKPKDNTIIRLAIGHR